MENNSAINKLKDIMSNEEMSWEVKHHKIFLDGLKDEVVKEVGMSFKSNNVKSDKGECEDLLDWVLLYG